MIGDLFLKVANTSVVLLSSSSAHTMFHTIFFFHTYGPSRNHFTKKFGLSRQNYREIGKNSKKKKAREFTFLQVKSPERKVVKKREKGKTFFLSGLLFLVLFIFWKVVEKREKGKFFFLAWPTVFGALYFHFTSISLVKLHYFQLTFLENCVH